MKTRTLTFPRALALLALLALAPFGLWSCVDAGDEPSDPTGPTTEYNAEIDYSHATIAVRASDSGVEPGQTFTVTATFTDANGALVTGAPLVISSEIGDYLSTSANPTDTDDDGKASFEVAVSTDCPKGSYQLAVSSYPGDPIDGPIAVGYVSISVSGGGISSVTLSAVATSVTYGLGAPFIATATVTSDCTPVFYYQAGGAGVNTSTWTSTGSSANPNFFTVPTDGGTTGTMAVIVRAYCSGNASAYVESSTVNVTITP